VFKRTNYFQFTAGSQLRLKI